MDTTLFWTVIGTGVAIIVAMYNFYRNFKEDINKRTDQMKADVQVQTTRIDAQYAAFIDMQKELKDMQKEFKDTQINMQKEFKDTQLNMQKELKEMQKQSDQKFYDLLKSLQFRTNS